jgi:hypothetical protein
MPKCRACRQNEGSLIARMLDQSVRNSGKGRKPAARSVVQSPALFFGRRLRDGRFVVDLMADLSICARDVWKAPVLAWGLALDFVQCCLKAKEAA